MHKFRFMIISTVIMRMCYSEKDNEDFESLQKQYKEKCYDGLGCVVLTSEWTDSKYRPVNILPLDRHVVNTIFVKWRYERNNITSEILGTRDLNHTNIRSCLKLFIHDFTSSGYAGWIQHLARLLLANNVGAGKNATSSSAPYCPLNIVSVDWAAGAQPPYVQAVANARLVALEVVNFLNNLKDTFNLDPSSVHIVGHGLGAHIAGYVGKMLQVHKITALDPSGPYFQFMSPPVRLHQDDAKFVEVVHTDIDGSKAQGYRNVLGHVDYYPNGGHEQPGCKPPKQKLTSVTREDIQLGETMSACSHKRSVKYYIEALVNSACNFVGVACNSFREFVKGHCSSCGPNSELCSILHPLADIHYVNSSMPFYFITSKSTPFCGEMLKIILILKRKRPSDRRIIKGYFKITIPQDNGEVNFYVNENHAFAALRNDKHHSFVVFRSTPPALKLPARVVYMKWLHSPIPCTWCTVPQIESIMIYKLGSESETSCQWFRTLANVVPNEPTLFGLEPWQREYLNKKEVTTTALYDDVEY